MFLFCAPLSGRCYNRHKELVTSLREGGPSSVKRQSRYTLAGSPLCCPSGWAKWGLFTVIGSQSMPYGHTSLPSSLLVKIRISCTAEGSSPGAVGSYACTGWGRGGARSSGWARGPPPAAGQKPNKERGSEGLQCYQRR